jgi:hypothetical protein
LTAILTAVECFTSMVVACLPAMRPLLKTRLFQGRTRPRRSSSAGGRSTGGFSDRTMGELESAVSYDRSSGVPLSRLEKVGSPRSVLPESETKTSVSTLVTNPVNSNNVPLRFGYVRHHNKHSFDDDFGFDDFEDANNHHDGIQLMEQPPHSQNNPMIYHQFGPQERRSPFPIDEIGTLNQPNGQLHHTHSHASSMNAPPYAASSPLPLPPIPGNDDPIVPTYILDEPLPNPVI